MPSRSTLRRSKPWKKCVVFTAIFVYGVVPALILVFPSIASFILLSHSIPFYFGDLKDPASFGLMASRQVDVTTHTGDTLCLWHILPESALDENKAMSDAEFDHRMTSGVPIFIYVHGSGGTRGQFTRLYTYTALRGQGMHVVAFDFRGFADSTGHASESNMVEDTITIFHWVKKHAESSPIFIWGHSLGASVAVQAARLISARNLGLTGLVVEGSFTSVEDVMNVAFITLPYRPFPFLMQIFNDALKQEQATFAADQHLVHVKCPVLMIHAEDDRIIPVDLARKLFNSVRSSGLKDQLHVTLHMFPASKGYGHNRVNQAPDLGSLVKKFVRDSQKPRKGP